MGTDRATGVVIHRPPRLSRPAEALGDLVVHIAPRRSANPKVRGPRFASVEHLRHHRHAAFVAHRQQHAPYLVHNRPLFVRRNDSCAPTAAVDRNPVAVGRSGACAGQVYAPGAVERQQSSRSQGCVRVEAPPGGPHPVVARHEQARPGGLARQLHEPCQAYVYQLPQTLPHRHHPRGKRGVVARALRIQDSPQRMIRVVA